MPKREDIKSILIIGAGPIIIGQGCEFDYSGTQACKVLKQQGYKIILVNSNPATIMTDPDVADRTYIEPIEIKTIEKIIQTEKPDALLPTMGGQTALNITIQLEKEGVLKKHNVEIIGAKSSSIEKAENRKLFKKAMSEINLKTPRSKMCYSISDALEIAKQMGYPLILRPSFTLGGTGGGIAYTETELLQLVRKGLFLSPSSEILIEESVIGWKEFEMEVIRDKNDNCIIVCSIENIDPMGVHTGDSITVAPALTLTDKEYQQMRNASIKVLRKIGVETGGANVQFAVNPENGDLQVIEMNPRVSRSSALASKATGFPIAKVAALLAVGFSIDEINETVTNSNIPPCFEPTVDYVALKIPFFNFNKFPQSDDTLTTSMKSVGEILAFGKNFKEALQKAYRSLEQELTGLDPIISADAENNNLNENKLIQSISQPHQDRLRRIADAIRNNLPLNKIYDNTKIDPWFLQQIQEIVELEKLIKHKHQKITSLVPDKAFWQKVKSDGFGNQQCANLTGATVKEVKDHLRKLKINCRFNSIDGCAGELESNSQYFYSTYAPSFYDPSLPQEAEPSDSKKVIILGSGPNRIGQGIEFDYACCHACFQLKEMGYEAIMINCNPETVSTDYDTASRLYFEAIDQESIQNIIEHEQQKGQLLGVIVQFGGQTPLKLAAFLHKNNIPILGHSYETICMGEDRELFQNLLNECLSEKVKKTQAVPVYSLDAALKVKQEIKLPIIVRPSFVLGGRGMEIVREDKAFKQTMQTALAIPEALPILIEKYIENGLELDVEVIGDNQSCKVIAIMQHIEEAGIHSGDSAAIMPPPNLPPKQIKLIEETSIIIAKQLKICGVMNIQYMIKDSLLYLIEVNPRASRTLPFIAKALSQSFIKNATSVIMGHQKVSELKLKTYHTKYYAVKEAVFPFNRFDQTDVILGPEMRSTGEIMGLGKNLITAFYKSQLASGNIIPDSGVIAISLKNNDKNNPSLIKAIQKLCLNNHDNRFKFRATVGTYNVFKNIIGENIQLTQKNYAQKPNIATEIENGEVDIVLNTASGLLAIADSKELRRAALINNIPYYTTLSAICMVLEVMSQSNVKQFYEITALQDLKKITPNK